MAVSFQYPRIADALRLQVEGLPPNTLLPTEHQLARQFGVSRLTIRQALQLLQGRASSRDSAAGARS